jgi:hypothetical protein
MEMSALGQFMRHSGPWTYALVNLSHILGVASLFGSVLLLDLRLIGLWPRMPLALLADAAVPIAVTGFSVAALSGVGLFATKATEYADNPFLLIKFPAIALAIVNVAILNRTTAWRMRATRPLVPREQRLLAVMGGVSLTCWLTAIAAGRLVGYW